MLFGQWPTCKSHRIKNIQDCVYAQAGLNLAGHTYLIVGILM